MGRNPVKPFTSFWSNSKQSGKISQRTDSDLVTVMLSKLSGEAPTFVKGLNETELRGISCERLKQKLVKRFGEILPLQYYDNLLHEAKQEKAESPKQFLDCRRVLCSKTTKASSDPVEQRILWEEADCRLLSAFVRGTQEPAGRQLRFRGPTDLQEALTVATTVHDALKVQEGEKRAKIFAINRAGIRRYRCDRLGHMQRDCWMTKSSNTQNVRGGEVKRRAETVRVSRNSMRSKLPC
jgi:hypothetical protein